MTATREHLAGYSTAYEMLASELRYDKDTGLIYRAPRKSGVSGHGEPVGYLNTSQETGKSYIEIKVYGQTIPAHRIAWTLHYGEPPLMLVDHKNGDGTDNRIDNLRSICIFGNGKNLKMRYDNKLGITGVYLLKNGTYAASIRCERKQIHLGKYRDIFSAACARKAAEVRFGFFENHGTMRPL